MFGIEKIADGFDEIHKQNMQDIRLTFNKTMIETDQRYGDDSFLHYNMALSLGITDAVLDFVQSVGAGELDTLRLGEGVKKGGVGYLQDSIRLLTGAGAVIKVTKLARAAMVPGGINSCAFTSTMKAARLGATRLFAPLSSLGRNLITIERTNSTQKFLSISKKMVGQIQAELAAGGKPVNLTDQLILSPNFGGAKLRSLTELTDSIDELKGRATPLSIRSFADAEKHLKDGRGVLLLRLRWKTGNNHILAIHKTPFGIKIADQHGTFQSFDEYGSKFLEPLLQIQKKLNLVPGDSKTMHEWILKPSKLLEMEVDKIFESILIKDSILLQAFEFPPLLQSLNPNSLLNQIAVPVFQFPPDVLAKVHKKMREKIAQQPKTGSNIQTNGGKAFLTNTIGLRQSSRITGYNSDLGLYNQIGYEYTVVIGDTLFGLAKRYYGDAAKANLLLDINPELKLKSLPQNAQIPIGMTIRIQ